MIKHIITKKNSKKTISYYYTIPLQKNTNKKLSKDYTGPYKIIQIHNNNTASIRISQNKIKTYHFNLLKPYNVSEPKPGSSKDND